MKGTALPSGELHASPGLAAPWLLGKGAPGFPSVGRAAQGHTKGLESCNGAGTEGFADRELFPALGLPLVPVSLAEGRLSLAVGADRHMHPSSNGERWCKQLHKLGISCPQSRGNS